MINNKIILKSIFWVFLEKICTQVVSLIISLLLARILMPKDYGVIALILIFINIADALVTNGLGESLIQKKEVLISDFTSVFWCSLLVSCILYTIIFFISPFISFFFNIEEKTIIFRILGIKIIFAGYNTIQYAYAIRKFQYKLYFYATTIGTICSGIIGIIMAYKKMGIWSLVIQNLFCTIITTLMMSYFIDWKPKLYFNLYPIKSLLNFGFKLMGASLIITIYADLQSLLIGKFYSASDLSFYNRGNQFPNIIVSNFNYIINKVFFPVMSHSQNDKNEIIKIILKLLKITSYLIFPMVIGFNAISKPFIRIILTDKWIDCVLYIHIVSLGWILQPIQTINWQVIKALGRSDICLKIEIIKKIIGIMILLFSVKISVVAIAYSFTVLCFISCIINMYMVMKILKLSILEQIKNIIKPLLMSTIIWIVCSMICNTVINDYLKIIYSLIIGLLIYILMIYLFDKKIGNIIKQYYYSKYSKEQYL